MKTCIIFSSKRVGAGVHLALDFSNSWEAASYTLCLAESLVCVESGNETPEDAMALACSAAICGVLVHSSNSSSGMSTRTPSELIPEVQEIIVHSIHSEAMVVDMTDVWVTGISDGMKKVEDHSHTKMT
jgi:hypothetical protein